VLTSYVVRYEEGSIDQKVHVNATLNVVVNATLSVDVNATLSVDVNATLRM
jgi:hypothetical protein